MQPTWGLSTKSIPIDLPLGNFLRRPHVGTHVVVRSRYRCPWSALPPNSSDSCNIKAVMHKIDVIIAITIMLVTAARSTKYHQERRQQQQQQEEGKEGGGANVAVVAAAATAALARRCCLRRSYLSVAPTCFQIGLYKVYNTNIRTPGIKARSGAP